MFVVRRSQHNPIITPSKDNPWEAYAAFNGSPIKVGSDIHFLYRAQAMPERFEDKMFSLGTIAKAISKDGKSFKQKEQFILPDREWDRYGCEDPRVTYLKGKYYIFYTALSVFPFGAQGIKVGLAISKDLKTIDSKHLITPFNAKAMSLFPEKIGGKFTAILTAHTDEPPSKIAIVQFEKEEDMWSEQFWHEWHSRIDQHTLHIKRGDNERVEIGSAPLKTKYGWLVIYSHIRNYYSDHHKVFGVEALLLDLKDPRKVIARTHGPMLMPEESYELYGTVPNIIFPSGCTLEKDTLRIYYGAADTVCAFAEVSFSQLLLSMLGKTTAVIARSKRNPILLPTHNEWEKRAVFNPTAIELDSQIHIIYRAMSEDNTSTFGYAVTKDGEKIKTRSSKPIYIPREPFEQKRIPNGNSGCEDPRITKIGENLYLCYTAYNGQQAPAVAISSIRESDFLAGKWRWTRPVLLSPEGVDDKDACLMPVIKNGKHLLIHRINHMICGSYIDLRNLARETDRIEILRGRPGMWDSRKVGISSPPIKTDRGWLMLYHGISDDGTYCVGLALLDKNDPTKVIARTSDYIMAPVAEYEKVGQINNVVFPCGAVIRKNKLYIYYGAADSVACVAVADMEDIFAMFT